MITIEEAQKIILREIGGGPKQGVALKEALNRILAEEVKAPIDLPLFNASAMDGFAIHHEEAPAVFKNVGVVAAGSTAPKNLEAGEAVQIMTGAMIPSGATAVIPQEEVAFEKGDGKNPARIFVSRPVAEGEHFRKKGEEIRRGETALPQGTRLTPGVLGFLASLGIEEVKVYAPPRISILPTGSELVRGLSEITEGKIPESNSVALRAALQELNITPQILSPVPDIARVLHAIIEVQLQRSDFLFITGGVSVGTFDLVKDILQSLGVKTLFWGVSQKPGKPLFFGKGKSAFVFGLPGNPVSSLVCYYEYLRPSLLLWLGYDSVFLPTAKARLVEPFRKKEGRTHFLRAVAESRDGGWSVHIPGGQESHKMKSFLKSNCLAVIPQEASQLNGGAEVMIHWLPGGERP